MKASLTGCLEQLNARRQYIYEMGSEMYEMMLSGIEDGVSKSCAESAAESIREFLGVEEGKIFLNDAGFPKISEGEQNKIWKGTMQTIEQYEIRLRELIRKHT